MFQLNDNWKDFETFKECVETYAARIGFTTTIHSTTYIRCNRFGQKKNNGTKSRNYFGGQLKCGCEFLIGIRPSKYRKKEEKNSIRNYRSRPNLDSGEFVTIMKTSLQHTGGCTPGPANQVSTKNRAGKYIDNITEISLYQLCSGVLNGNRLTSSVSCFS